MLISNTCSFKKKVLSNLRSVLIYSLRYENFVKLTKKYPWRSLMLKKLHFYSCHFFEPSAPQNIIS